MTATLSAPWITMPTRIDNNGEGTLADDIFTDTLSPNISSGNLKVRIMDNFPWFLIVPIAPLSNISPKAKFNINVTPGMFLKMTLF